MTFQSSVTPAKFHDSILNDAGMVLTSEFRMSPMLVFIVGTFKCNMTLASIGMIFVGEARKFWKLEIF